MLTLTPGLRAFALSVFLVAPCLAQTPAAQPFETSFASPDGTVLSGSVYLPTERHPVAAVVYVDGAGPTARNIAIGERLAERGIVVLTYDKRGVGRSGGRYEDENNVSATNLAVLAADARAALAALQDDARWRGLPQGYVGYSQAGWVIPIALSGAGAEPDFIALLSGPVCSTSEQLHYQRFTESRSYDPSRWTEEDVEREMSTVRLRQDDVDPTGFLRGSAVSGLWLFGGRDVYVPVQLSTQRLQQLIGSGSANLEYRVFDGSGHDLTGPQERDAFEALVQWIGRRADGASR